MTDKLTIYNGALSELDEPPLSSLTEGRSARRTLDVFYQQAINLCLENGQWTFATRLLKLNASVSVTPSFGKQFFFDKPTDYVKLVGIWNDENLIDGVGYDYDEDKFGWYANSDVIYVKYISNDAGYGGDINKWSASFLQYVQIQLALLSCSIAGSRVKKGDLTNSLLNAIREAKNVDSWGKPARKLPYGSWVKSRIGNCRLRNYERS